MLELVSEVLVGTLRCGVPAPYRRGIVEKPGIFFPFYSPLNVGWIVAAR